MQGNVLKDSQQKKDSLVQCIISEFTLNETQCRAFKLISDHSLSYCVPPLRMFVGGQGGTGKSCVIKAVKAFFEHSRQGGQIQLTSYMGVAA